MSEPLGYELAAAAAEGGFEPSELVVPAVPEIVPAVSEIVPAVSEVVPAVPEKSTEQTDKPD